jgi:peptide/nickel transport system permease protein
MATVRTKNPKIEEPPDSKANLKLPKQESLWTKALKRFMRHRAAMAGLIILLVIVLVCVFAGVISSYKPDKPDILLGATEPNSEHLFGTDELGRDVFTRVLYGGQISLTVGTLAVIVSVVIGTLVGAFAGFFGGWVDNLLMRFTDFALCFPSLFLLILLVSVFGSNFLIIIFVIGGLNWMGTARLVRSSFLSIKEKDFVEAARAIGVKSNRIMWRHILPNATGPLIVTATLGMAGGIISETSLSFLGLGIQPPTPSWGNMLKEAQDVFTTAPWLAIFPGLLIFLTVLSINYIGDGLRDALDPKGKL